MPQTRRSRYYGRDMFSWRLSYRIESSPVQSSERKRPQPKHSARSLRIRYVVIIEGAFACALLRVEAVSLFDGRQD